ncbi:helix-turn-helix domain-containing protein [Pseudomonas fragi]|uniref:helix-turn-helix domain-containing protein n=1 Tax=Pseudomonas fragi TaxID=296 RepID=UPI00037BE743|nr:helix-turn-helix transcriptional regulator [Pseudomonas fragi]MDE4513416.1 XRE family transcriptional regulator [Pseudomonas fragi]QPC34185.1 helix-turn-helix transcriptional regulator [Pseudomonas fragi]SDT94260.1 Helix-turn-helix domain-containing protein [Pseudomonas fragi]
MSMTIYRHEHDVLLSLLKKHRKEAGLTQVECSKALERPQSFMSDVETGSRRLDIVQLRDLCKVLGIGLQDLIAEFERLLEKR